jgi:hypothetical protein
MSFNLNGEEFKSQGTVIFNNGEAGKVENVAISVEKKTADMADNAPDYKVIFTDNNKAQVNMGIYYPTPNAQFDDAKNESLAKLSVGKVLSIARSVLGKDYEFPPVNSAKEAVDVCMKLTAQNAANKKVNVFVTYGTMGSPKKYLGIYKNFDFIEEAGASPSRLRQTSNPSKPQYNDLMERVVEDEVQAPVSLEPNGTTVLPPTTSWL